LKDSQFIYDLDHCDYSYPGSVAGKKVLNKINLRVAEGEFVAICGASGSGKSTLLYLFGGMLAPDDGRVFFKGRDLWEKSELERAEIRNQQIGFVFQQFHLVPRMTVLQNIMLPANYPSETNVLTSSDQTRALELLELVGLGQQQDSLPNQLSGGQQQRVAIARALLRNPAVILADEPTGNLDSENSEQVLQIFEKIQKAGHTVIMITHEADIANRAERMISVKDGMVLQEHPFDKIPGPSATLPRDTPKRELAGVAMQRLRIWRNVLPLGVQNLRTHLMRTALTMLGVIIAIASIIALLTLGDFAKARIMETYEALGSNRLSLNGYRNWRQSASRKSTGSNFRAFDIENDLYALLRVFPEIKNIAPISSVSVDEVSYGGNKVSEINVIGTNSNWPVINNRSLEYGKFLSPYHVRQGDSVCVIGAEVRKELFSQQKGLGEVLYISNSSSIFQCRVIGVMRHLNKGASDSDPNNQVIMPYSYLQTVGIYWARYIRNAAILVQPGSNTEILGQKIVGFFVNRYGTSGQFRVTGDEALLTQVKKFLQIFTILLVGIGGVTLVVGGIGVTNMMLISVGERYREIGLRKALGATDRSIKLQLLIEALTVTSMAGAIGGLVGFVFYEGVVWIASQFVESIQFEWFYNPMAIVIALLSIVSVGILSGIAPAIKAQRLDVVAALRSE
jgi:macrolide transport system ATP-binding/permease protein